MSDLADITQERMEMADSLRGALPRYELPPGTQGNCDGCERESPRLIGGLCGACRDGVGIA